MAFPAPSHKEESAITPNGSGRARSDNRSSSLKSTTKPAVGLDNTSELSKNSSTKSVRAASLASFPMGPKTASLATATSLRRKRNLVTVLKDGSDKDKVSARVRVAVRLRPRNADETILDKDRAECLELQPEMKRVQLRKNNWEYDHNYRFDEVLTETSSQKRVYEVVAKPVVESVCEGYNGTVMAYGQSGTGKTFTLGNLGEKDSADRGIMVRAFEDILSSVASASATDTVTVSYLQLYKETVQDLLAPEHDNIAIVEDPKTGDVSVPRARQVGLKDLQSFLQLLQTGEANRFAANTKLNTGSSRSHAILLVNLKMVMKANIGDTNSANLDENGDSPQFAKGIPAANTVRKSKLLIVDLAGSERIDKSGSEGHVLEEAKFINLSLTALGKCINALAENSPHVPIRDSKLTRMLRDSFGGTARTSLIVTIGPSPRNRGETASTIAFGQRAMKVENLLKLKEEFDYRRRCQQLEIEVDKLMAENERQRKGGQEVREDFERRLEEAQHSAASAKDKLATAEKKEERLKKEHADILEKLAKSEKDHKDVLETYQQEIKDRKRHEEKKQQEFTEANLRSEKEHKDVVDSREDFKRRLEEAQSSAASAEDKLVTAERKEERLTKEHAAILEKLTKSEKDHTDFLETYQQEIKERKRHEEKQQQEFTEANLRTEKEHKGVVDSREDFKRRLEDAQSAAASAEDKIVTAERKEERLTKEHADLLEKLKKSEKERKDIVEKYQYEITDRKRHRKKEQEIAEANLTLTGGKAESEKLEKEIIEEHSQSLLQKESPQKIPELQELKTKLEKETQLRVKLQEEVGPFHLGLGQLPNAMEIDNSEKFLSLKQKLEEREYKETLEEEVKSLKKQVMVLSDDRDESRKLVHNIRSANSSEGSHRRSAGRMKDQGNGKKATTATLFEHVGLLKTMSLLESEDVDVRIYNVEVVAQLAAEEANQEHIVKAGGLGYLLGLLQSYEDETVRRMAAHAIFSLSTNESIQALIIAQGGIELLARTADDAEDPQTLRIVAGAIANLCANTRLHVRLREEGGIRNLLSMVRSNHPEVLAQVARGISNFATCESRGAAQDYTKRRSMLIDGGALPWVVANAKNDAAPIRRHIEVALCHLAQHEANSNDLIAGGALSELVRISQECSQENIRDLVRQTVNANNTFQTELKRRHFV